MHAIMFSNFTLAPDLGAEEEISRMGRKLERDYPWLLSEPG